MNRLKDIRARIGITQSGLAEMAGCTKGAISHYEKGRRQLTLQRCQRIVEIFNMLGFKCSLDDVFPSSGNKAA